MTLQSIHSFLDEVLCFIFHRKCPIYLSFSRVICQFLKQTFDIITLSAHSSSSSAGHHVLQRHDKFTRGNIPNTKISNTRNI